MPTHVEIEGDKELTRTLREAAREISDFGKTNAAVAEIIVGVVRPLTPVDTGYLQESNQAVTDEANAAVYNPLEYAPVIHNGWPAHHIAPTPFLEEGFADSMDRWAPLYMDRVRDVIDDVKGA